jgi:hypothetical protein
MAEIKWDYKEKASPFWYLLGIIGGIGYFVGMIYVLITNNKNRIWSLFFLLGPIGSIILYFVFKTEDKKLVDMSVKLLIGYIISIIIIIVLGVSYWAFF